MPRVPRVKLGERASRDPLEHLLWKDPKELPPDVEGFEYRPVKKASGMFINSRILGCLYRSMRVGPQDRNKSKTQGGPSGLIVELTLISTILLNHFPFRSLVLALSKTYIQACLTICSYRYKLRCVF